MPQSLRQVQYTYEDYLLFPEDGKRHELIVGDHFMSPAPLMKHQKISANLFGLIWEFLKKNMMGQIFAAPTDVLLSDLDIVQPDLLFISTAKTAIITEKNIQGAPDLVVEILSESTRKTDEIIKRKLYERYGVMEYWIVDPELETIKVYQMTDTGYVRSSELSLEKNDTLATLLIPHFFVPLSEIFKR